MIAQLLAKIFGTQNERELKRLQPLVAAVNSFEPAIQKLSDEELAAKTAEFKRRIEQGESLDALLPEAFAVAREAGQRTLGMRHFDVQLMGGIVLHQGKIAEMKTGEGKTFMATLPLYLNALAGKGSHLVTVNDYLARRDAEWMKPLYNFLGLTVGIIQNSMDDKDRKAQYAADITYGTNNEYGFDYLRDNMKFDLEDYVQRDPFFAIVDEVDSILIDEARTPLIISGASERGVNFYEVANKAVRTLKKEDCEIDEKARSVTLTESGNDQIESFLHVENLYAPENILLLHHITQALKANILFKKDVDYIVREGEVFIVDEFTGRVLPGRRYSDGLHQALEAKEGVKIERENQTLASITLQNYFRLYAKLSGMTGTAETEAGEFHKIYKLGVVVIPTNRAMIRQDQADIIYLTREDKFKGVIEDIKACYEKGQPVLVGTISIEASEYLSQLLKAAGIPHNVLNAKQHEREADIVAEAGQRGKITIATNMAGRGTDIKLTDEVRELGGLRVIGTERHESRRIDNQLRGRAGRQGDPASSKFYISLEDDLIRIFSPGDRMKRMMERFGMQPGESIEHPMVTRSIEGAQEKVEKHNFDIRKHLIEYDDVLNQQRTVIYTYRREILEGADQTKLLIEEMIGDVINQLLSIHCAGQSCDNNELDDVVNALHQLSGMPREHFLAVVTDHSVAALSVKLTNFLQEEYGRRRQTLPHEVIQQAEKWILLEMIDQAWKIHLQNIDHLKEGIGFRGYSQKNPLIEYKKESFFEFEKMMHQIKWDIVHHIFKVKAEEFSQAAVHSIEKEREEELALLSIGGQEKSDSQQPASRREGPKVGRNDVCPCGSGKKYKQCCGR